MRFLSIGVLGCFAAAACLPAQTLLTFDPGTATIFEMAALSPLSFMAMTPMPPPIPTGIAGFAFVGGAPVVPPGDIAVNSMNGMIYYSNGNFVAALRHPAYPAAAPIPPFPAPPFPAPPCWPICNAPFVSGMAVDPVAGILWVTNGYVVEGIALAPLPVVAIVFPPFVPMPGVAIGLLTGLEWDGLTGSLWAVNAAGIVYNFAPGGAFIGAIAPPTPTPAGTVVTGVTVDKSAGVAIYVSMVSGAASGIRDYVTGMAFPVMPPGAAVGVAYHANPMRMPLMPGGCPCASLGPNGFQSLNPMTQGVATWGVDWFGLPPFAPVFVAIDVFFNPAFPMLNAVGCPFGFNLASPSLAILAGAANGAGRFSLPVSLVGAPVVPPIYFQYATPCAADPVIGLVLSPLFQLAISGT